MTTTPPVTELRRSVRVGYGAGSVSTGAFATVPGLLLLPYLTDTLGIGALAAGLLVLLPKAWDVVVNPIAGRVGDRTVDPRGPRRPWLLRAGLALAVGFALLFAAPASDSQLVGAAWVLVFFVVCATAFAFFQVAFVAMPAEMTGSYDERTRLMGWRIVFLALTILVTGAGAPLVRDAVGGRDGYRVMGVVVACVIAAGVVAVYLGTRSAPIGTTQAAHGGLRDQLRVVAGARDFRMLLLTYVVQALAVGCMLAGVDYLASDVLDSEAATTFLFVAFVAPALLLTPVWTRVGERVGKKAGYTASSVVFAVGAFGVVLARTESLALVLVAVTLVGVGYAGCQVFPLAMLPDVAALDARRTGENRVGVYTGVWTGTETLGLAVGPGLFALGLAIGGYRSSTDGGVAQGDGALLAITLGCSIVPGALTLASLWWLRRFTLTSDDVEATA